MIIYHALSFYQLLTCVVHSCLRSEHEKILILGSNVQKVLCTPLLLEKIFDKVVYIDISMGLANASTCKQDVEKYFDGVLKTNNIEIKDDVEIYVGGAHFNFGLYMVVKQIPFYFIEDACGMLSNVEHLLNINCTRNVHKVLEENGLYNGTGDNVKGVVCNINQQDKELDRVDLIHFDTLYELSRFDKEKIGIILDIFTDIDEIKIKKDTVLVLSQHYANLNMMSYERQALLYGLVFDYYLKGKNILVKKHPYDFTPYEIIYPNIKQIKERFPSEFLPLITDNEPDMIATISSTGIKSLKSVAKKYMEFDFDFEQYFEPLHKVYNSLEMILEQGSVDKIYTIGVNKAMIENMCKYTLCSADIKVVVVMDISEIEEGSIVFVDRIEKSCMADWNIECIAEYFTSVCPAKQVFFINSNRDYLFHKSQDETVWNNIVPIVIEKINKNDNRDFELYNDFETETLYLFTKNKEIRRMAIEFENKIELDNLQIEVRTRGFETKEQMRISVLEGILDATEQRLNHYIRKCNDLEIELNKSRK